jgi:uncharacterized protein YdbL (DUF1318 family)
MNDDYINPEPIPKRDRTILRVGSHASGYLHEVKRAATVAEIDAEIKRLHAINSASLPTTQGRDW